MIKRERIIYDSVPQPRDEVVFAVVLIDSFTGEIIKKNTKVELLDQHNGNAVLPFTPILNLSGFWVFVNLPAQPFYRIKIYAEEAGYFDPALIDYIPPAPNDPQLIDKRKHQVVLYRKAEKAAQLESTVVAGVVERNNQPVESAEVTVEIPPALVPPAMLPIAPFKTYTDARGAFGLPMRLPQDAVANPISVTFTMQEGADQRQFVRDVKERKFYSFEEAIDLTGNVVSNNPQLIEFGG